MSGKKESATYIHGYHPPVLRAHGWRTAVNSAGYLLQYLKLDMKILDIGYGTGTITVDLANHVPRDTSPASNVPERGTRASTCPG